MKNLNTKTNQTQEIFNQLIEDGNIDVRQFLIDGMSDLLNRAFACEREFYLASDHCNKANGYSNRNVNFGTSLIPVAIPRDRNSNFYPSFLPKYARNISDEYSNILESIILNSKSFRSVYGSIKSLGLSYSTEQV